MTVKFTYNIYVKLAVSTLTLSFSLYSQKHIPSIALYIYSQKVKFFQRANFPLDVPDRVGVQFQVTWMSFECVFYLKLRHSR